MVERHIPKYYPSQEIPDLPRQCTLRDGHDVAMTYLKTTGVHHIHALAAEAAQHDLNVGRDEFESVADLEYLLNHSEAFTFHRHNVLVGVLILQPSWYSTSWRKHTCDIRIIPSMWLYERGGVAMLLEIGQELVLQLGLLYDAAAVCVFLGAKGVYQQVRDAGFTPTAVLPNIGYTSRGKHKPQKAALLYKQLTSPAKVS